VGTPSALITDAASGPTPFPRRALVAGGAGIALLVVTWFSPLPVPVPAKHALAVTTLLIVFWIFEVAPHAITGMLGCWLFWALKVASPRTAFAGFSNDAPWFLLGALFLGAMATESGLARRLAFTLLSRLGTSYSRLLLAFILTSFVMTFMIPAGPPRVILLGTIALGAVAGFGLDRKGNVAKGLILAITFTATLFDKSIIGSTPAILARNLIVEFGKVPVYWSQWFLAFLPLDLFNILAAWWLIRRLYPAEKAELAGRPAYLREQLALLGPWSTAEKKAAVWIVVAVGLWSTDFVHHINPSLVGLGVGLAAALPGVGVLTQEQLGRVRFLIILFMGSTISMTEVLRETGALDALAGALFGVLAPHIHNVMTSTLLLYWSAFAAHLVLASETSMIAASMPLVMRFALENHLSPLALGLVWSFATGGKLFIYQSLVLIAGHSFGVFDSRDVLRVGAFFLLVQSFVILLLAPYYWPLLGID